ncbi:Peptidyl-prolyl cis-trans isomerase FKBP17-1, chloroplastic [Linum perenne]
MKDGAPDLMMMSLAYRAEFMKEASEKSQSITDSMVSILGSFNHRLSALEIAMRPTQVAIHYYDRLGAKQGWRFDSNYDHKDGSGEPIPFVFVIGFGLISSTTSISGSKRRYTGISVSFRLDPSHSMRSARRAAARRAARRATTRLPAARRAAARRAATRATARRAATRATARRAATRATARRAATRATARRAASMRAASQAADGRATEWASGG